MAEKIVKLLQSPTDRQDLGKKHMAYVRTHHTIEAMTRSYYEIYRLAQEQFDGKRDKLDTSLETRD